MANELIPEGMARLHITYEGEAGDLSEPLLFDLPDDQVRTIAQEAIRGGSVVGIAAKPYADLSGYQIDRFEAKDGLPCRVAARPKTAFG